MAFHTRHPICPHCGSVERDAWEIDFGLSDSADIQCDKCEKTYHCTRHVSTTYITARIDTPLTMQ